MKWGEIVKKQKAIMRAAEELLSAAIYTVTIYDSLNCGKLGRLFNYISGSSVTVVWDGYGEDMGLAVQEGHKCIIKR